VTATSAVPWQRVAAVSSAMTSAPVAESSEPVGLLRPGDRPPT
jgi:hypothetical protein